MRIEMLTPELWLLLLPLPLVVYFAAKTYADAGRARRIVMGALRILVLVLVAAALVQVRMWRKADESRLCVLALVDVSESMPANTAEDVAKELAAVSAGAGEDRQFGLVLFAGRSEVAIPPAPKAFNQAEVAEVLKSALAAAKGSEAYTRFERQDTRFDGAFELALSSFPPELGRRIVVWSDGNETAGRSLDQAADLSRNGVDIHTRAVAARDPALDVLVAELNAPTQVRIQEAYDVRVTVMANREIAGQVRLFRNGFLVGNKDAQLAKGSTELVFRQSLPESGQYLYRAVVEVSEPQRKENDEAFAYTVAQGLPRVLLVGQLESESARLVEALRNQHMLVEYRDAFGSPQTLLDLFGFDAVILNNVHATKLTENQMRMLRDYVRDFGGGLVVLGGRYSLGPGQYAGTALEDALPVTCSAEEMPELSSSVAVVVDTSHSLVNQKNDAGVVFDGAQYVRETCKALMRNLSPKSFYGVIGTGSEKVGPRWFVRLQKVYDREQIERDLQAAFGTPAQFNMSSNVHRSMRRAADELAQLDTMKKHLIVVSDGQFDAGPDYEKLAAQIGSSRIQISAIPVGPQANERALETLARWGGGICFSGMELSNLNDELKRLFASSAENQVLEEPFRVRKLVEAPLLSGVDVSLAPMLFGYVRTKLKLGASNVLAVPPEYEPLLASWNCGAGKAAVFTSDAKERWAILWIREWGRHFESFWGSVVKGVMRYSDEGRLAPNLAVHGQSVDIDVDYLGRGGEWVSGKDLHCDVYDLGEQGYLYAPTAAVPVPLEGRAPGRYSGSFRASRKGIFAVKVSGPEHGLIATRGLVVSNFKEYLSLGTNPGFLKELAQAGGGQFGGEPAALGQVDGKSREELVDLGHWAALAAAILFGLDVIARRWPAFRRLLGRKA
ncbi:MAG: VWA domain-containing protein [Planctomycetes bacterium]|nr:VWA domain-containing protein [Planctomycetota bacterium]